MLLDRGLVDIVRVEGALVDVFCEFLDGRRELRLPAETDRDLDRSVGRRLVVRYSDRYLPRRSDAFEFTL